MASLDNLEGDLIEGTGAIIAVIVLGLLLYAFIVWRRVKVPYQLYPNSIVGSTATGIDYLFSNTALAGSSYQRGLDHFFGGLYGWTSSNLPDYSKSPSYADYSAANADGGDSTTVNAADPYGTGN